MDEDVKWDLGEPLPVLWVNDTDPEEFKVWFCIWQIHMHSDGSPRPISSPETTTSSVQGLEQRKAVLIPAAWDQCGADAKVQTWYFLYTKHIHYLWVSFPPRRVCVGGCNTWNPISASSVNVYREGAWTCLLTCAYSAVIGMELIITVCSWNFHQSPVQLLQATGPVSKCRGGWGMCGSDLSRL